MAFIVNTKPHGEKPDIVDMQRAQARQRVDATDKYVYETVTVDIGPANTRVAVKLKLQVNSPYAFAVYRDNSAFFEMPETVWQEAAKRALTKLIAIRTNGQIVQGPKQEITAPMNFFVEARVPLAVETV